MIDDENNLECVVLGTCQVSSGRLVLGRARRASSRRPSWARDGGRMTMDRRNGARCLPATWC